MPRVPGAHQSFRLFSSTLFRPSFALYFKTPTASFHSIVIRHQLLPRNSPHACKNNVQAGPPGVYVGSALASLSILQVVHLPANLSLFFHPLLSLSIPTPPPAHSFRPVHSTGISSYSLHTLQTNISDDSTVLPARTRHHGAMLMISFDMFH